jgi:hypothetical protein
MVGVVEVATEKPSSRSLVSMSFTGNFGKAMTNSLILVIADFGLGSFGGFGAAGASTGAAAASTTGGSAAAV